jgi:hypothetical protein
LRERLTGGWAGRRRRCYEYLSEMFSQWEPAGYISLLLLEGGQRWPKEKKQEIKNI